MDWQWGNSRNDVSHVSQLSALEQVSFTEPRELRLEDMVERMNRTQVVLLSVKE